jgi:opacity protein-like surface antigen
MTISVVRSAGRGLALAAAIAAIALASPISVLSATAADLLVPTRGAPAAAPLWTGFYIGVHGGEGWGNTQLSDPSFSTAYETVSFASKGALAGAQVGANWQFGNVVVGGELDASWGDINGTAPQDPRFPGFIQFSTQFRALATGTGRVGYAVGNFLPYAKAGVAWANIDMNGIIVVPNQNPTDVNHQRTGLTAGAGLEWALMGNLSAKVEYDFLYFGESSISLGGRGPDNVSHSLNVLKAGLNWRFRDDYFTARN